MGFCEQKLSVGYVHILWLNYEDGRMDVLLPQKKFPSPGYAHAEWFPRLLGFYLPM